MAGSHLSKDQWKALPKQRKKRNGKGVRLIKIKEGDADKWVEVRVFAKAENVKDAVPPEWLQ